MLISEVTSPDWLDGVIKSVFATRENDLEAGVYKYCGVFALALIDVLADFGISAHPRALVLGSEVSDNDDGYGDDDDDDEGYGNYGDDDYHIERHVNPDGSFQWCHWLVGVEGMNPIDEGYDIYGLQDDYDTLCDHHCKDFPGAGVVDYTRAQLEHEIQNGADGYSRVWHNHWRSLLYPAIAAAIGKQVSADRQLPAAQPPEFKY